MSNKKKFTISFLGAAETVTGSRYLLESDTSRVLVDCGLFQGYKKLRQRNWAPPGFTPASLDAVVLTHAHLDHSGALPLLVKQGFHGKVFATPATIEACRIMLPDSGRLQEEDAEYLGRHHRSRHASPQPLYTEDDAQIAKEDGHIAVQIHGGAIAEASFKDIKIEELP